VVVLALVHAVQRRQPAHEGEEDEHEDSTEAHHVVQHSAK
jgi:hypothetical protein